MVQTLDEHRVAARRHLAPVGLRAERPRPSDPGGDEDVPDDREIERGREDQRDSPTDPSRSGREEASR
jgi:hypothetical protein